jgi:lipopolysaccharide/colanic/teichoic acid biosynthesis glycosyltransferase
MATDVVGVALETPEAQRLEELDTFDTYAFAKRLVDVVLALTITVVLSPALLLCALAVALETGRPVLFRQERVGERGRRFTMIKFRSMTVNADTAVHRAYITAYIAGEPPAAPSQARPVYKLTQDPRVTRVGAWLRRTSLDELPQLWNVLRGDMSLVGPRPPIAYEVQQYQPAHLRRLDAKPGITGLWQVRGRSRTSFEEMVAMDVEYIARRSLRLDVLILLKTLPAVLLRKGAH